MASQPGSRDGPWRLLRRGMLSFLTLRPLPFCVFIGWSAAGGSTAAAPKLACQGCREAAASHIGVRSAVRLWAQESPAGQRPRLRRPLPLLIGLSSLKAAGGPLACVSAIKTTDA